MADILTVWEHRGNLDNLKIVYIGDGNNIVHSWLQLATRLPFEFICVCPAGYNPNRETMKLAEAAGLSSVSNSMSNLIRLKWSSMMNGPLHVWKSLVPQWRRIGTSQRR